MPIVLKDWITREMVQAEPEARFVFGDNMVRVGLGGQAKAMRGEPNSIGVATKRKPTMEEDAFFADRPDEFEVVTRDLEKIQAAFDEGRTIYVPADGIGTGLAQLPQRSPHIHNLIKQYFEVLGVRF